MGVCVSSTPSPSITIGATTSAMSRSPLDTMTAATRTIASSSMTSVPHENMFPASLLLLEARPVSQAPEGGAGSSLTPSTLPLSSRRSQRSSAVVLRRYSDRSSLGAGGSSGTTGAGPFVSIFPPGSASSLPLHRHGEAVEHDVSPRPGGGGDSVIGMIGSSAGGSEMTSYVVDAASSSDDVPPAFVPLHLRGMSSMNPDSYDGMLTSMQSHLTTTSQAPAAVNTRGDADFPSTSTQHSGTSWPASEVHATKSTSVRGGAGTKDIANETNPLNIDDDDDDERRSTTTLESSSGFGVRRIS